ncbi:dihydrofolate synthase [Pelobium manganitolerans]|uniref:Dihydrofolate synthase/folylpolyglutamate synthase n=1 Tax=Pelobium manganitolerans TaxID=1842495 RepID=A0A419S8H6_9SPHI|nr:folylpolyglutamate synthase/dihydrofolate synthase family protein [Pelobium manganitolerans]RKD18002.1 dihydrofolate synthase [Pelobium manganitolerans]
MTYPQTLDYLYTKLPMFTRVGASAFKKDLHNTIKFCQHLGHPEKKFKSIHIAGTNGKGSTSHMLAAVLQKAGYKTGLYTSPHLKDFRERIKINGEMIGEQQVVEFVERNRELIENLEPSFFETTVAMAFQHFATEQVDVAVIEVGLGGRLDSTNVIHPELSIITNIGFDHMSMLGNTLEEIAGEKAGIIKNKVPVVVGEYQAEIANVFENIAAEKACDLSFASEMWAVLHNHVTDAKRHLELQGGTQQLSLYLDLTGTYQIKNVKTVLTAVNQLRQLGFNISDDHLLAALSEVKTLTGLMGRWQTLQQQPLVICDTGHNEDGIKEVLQNIKLTPYQTLRMVIGMVKDKDISKILSLLPKNAVYYFCTPNLERAKPADELQREASEFGLVGEVFASVQNALYRAKTEAELKDLIFVGGSTFVVAEVV